MNFQISNDELTIYDQFNDPKAITLSQINLLREYLGSKFNELQ